MASQTRTIELTVRDGTNTIATESFTVTAADGVVAAGEIDLTASETNHLVTASVDVSNLKSVVITSSDTDVTIKTNSSGSPAETITVGPDSPYIWYEGMGMTNAFATDITALYITETEAATTTVTYEFLSTT